MMERLAFTVDEVAVLIGVSASTVKRMVYCGQLPAKRTDTGKHSRIVIPAASLESWLATPDEAPGAAAKRRNAEVAAAIRKKLRAI
ncbi:MAG: helix-turn-helix domain-containing protein [Thermoplasmatales archaeon]